ncbi:MAG: hypothetical protein R2854_05900 [Caldilineaceae bacterium]
MGRLVMLFFNIKLICPERYRFYGHDGFLAPNHVSFVDIVVLAALLPVRFLAAGGRQRPVLVGGGRGGHRLRGPVRHSLSA